MCENVLRDPLKVLGRADARLKLMAPAGEAAKRVSLTASPHWGEREVRRMLRGLRRPHRLETEPLARFLCHAYGIERPYDACLRLIRDALLDKGLVGKRLYDLIRISDVDATDTLVAAASKMGVSPRQFFRYRREAIVALASHANALGAAHPPPTSPVEELARLLSELDPAAGTRVYAIAQASDASRLQRLEAQLNAGIFPDDDALAELSGVDRIRALLKTALAAYLYGNTSAADAIVEAVRSQIADTIVEDREIVEYELAHVEYVRTLYRENATRAAQIAHRLINQARGDEPRVIAALAMEAESNIRCGELELAEQAITAAEDLIMPRKQLRMLSILISLRATLAFMRGELETAYAYLKSVQLALPDRRVDALTLNANIGRVSLELGLAWRAPRELLEIVEPPSRVLTPTRAGSPVSLDGSTRRLFHRLYLKNVDLRAALLAGELGAADEIAEILGIARDVGYPGIESVALATLALWWDRNGVRAETQRYAVAAWKVAVEFGDAFISYDLFGREAPAREFGAVDLERAFFEAFYASTARFGAIPLINAPPSVEKDAFWRATLLRARGAGESAAAEDAFLATLADAPAPEGVGKQRAEFVGAVVRDTAILLPATDRADFGKALSRSLDAFSRGLPVL